MKCFYSLRSLAFLVMSSFPWLRPAQAAPFAPGNLVVARVGDGAAPLTSAATEVFLDEYTPGGILVQSISLPTSVSGMNRILTASGNAPAELGLTRSADGRYLVLTGYSAAPGTPAVAASGAADVARVIGRIAADGSFDTSTSAGGAFSGTSIRAAATADGTSFYSVGGNSGVQYQGLGSAAATQLTAVPAAIRSINIAQGNLYISLNTSPYIGLSQVGAGLPTAAGQAAAVLPGFPATAAGASPYSFYLADLSPAVPGADVAYVADDRTIGGGIQKWSLVAGSWVLNGTMAGTASAAVRGLSGSASGATVSLAASSSTGLFFVEDTAGYNAAPSLTALPAAAATAGSNTAFRGVAFAPVAPAPAPAIASFTPASGPVGTLVTLTGANFTGATAVTLNGMAATGFTVVDAATITFVVPAGAGAGLIGVATPPGTATSSSPFGLVLAAQASQALPGLAVFPNPASEGVWVALPQGGPATVALRDLTGRVVQAPTQLAAQQPLRLPAQLAAGVYLLEVRQGAVTAVRRIEKK